RGLGGGARTDNGARARAVLDDDLLAKGRREFLRNHSAHRVRTAAGRVWHDQRNRTRRIGLRPRYARHGRECGSACCQMQKISAGKFHSTTSSASASSSGGLSSPSAFAVRECAERAAYLARFQTDSTTTPCPIDATGLVYRSSSPASVNDRF